MNGFEIQNQSSGRDAFSPKYQSNRDFIFTLLMPQYTQKEQAISLLFMGEIIAI